MAEEKSFPMDFNNLGLMLGVPADKVGPEHYTVFQNMESFRGGYIQSRLGSIERAVNLGFTANLLPAAPHSLGYLLQDVEAASFFEYMGIGTDLYAISSADPDVSVSDIAFGDDHIRFSGKPLTIDTYRINDSLLPHAIVFDRNKRVKMDGLFAEHFGIPGSTYSAASVVSGAGNLNGAYDWRYQYRVERTGSVSPLSPELTGIPAFGVLTSTGVIPTDGDTVTIDAIVYTFRITLSSGPAVAYEVHIGASAAVALDNLYFAVNSLGTIGVDYSTGTVIHPTVAATGNTDTTQRFESKIAGMGGNFIPVSTTAATLSWNNPTLSGADSIITANNKVDVTVRQPNDSQITHIDLYRRGGLLTDGWYFVKSAAVTGFAGTQVMVDDLGDAELGDIVATNQIEFSNILHPATSVRKTTNNGSSYTNYTSEAGDSSSLTHVDLSSLAPLISANWVVIGADLQFRKIAIGMDSVAGVPNFASINTAISTLAVSYWNGSAWVAVSRLTDGTASALGATFAQNGIIAYDFPPDWARSTIDSVSAYYVRLSVSSTLDAFVFMDGIRVSAMEFDASTFAIHADRLWADDETNPDRLWYSQRFRIEEFRDTSYLIVGKGGDRVRRVMELDDQLFAYTDRTVYRIIGTGQEVFGGGTDFQAYPTGAEHGLYARFAICKGAGRIYYRAYDGIYALGSGGAVEKLSDPAIDPLFRGIDGGEDVSTKAIFNTFNQLDHERMEYYNNKLYWSYRRTDGVVQELVYDFIMQRWYMTDRAVTAYLNITHQGVLFSAHTDSYIYLRETGHSDINNVVTPITMGMQISFMDYGEPQADKHFVEMVFDADVGTASIVLRTEIDNGLFITTHTISGTGRQRHWLKINGGIGVFGKNLSVMLQGISNANQPIKLYKITFNLWAEPRELNQTSWDWNDYGHPERKYLKQLVIDLDTEGTVADIFIYLDGATTPAVTFSSVQTTTKQRKVLSLPTDTECKIAKVLVRSQQAHWQVKAYAHYFNFLVNGLEVGKTQTDWTDRGHPADKRWRQVMVEINTFGADVQCAFEVDGIIKDAFTVNTPGRRWITRSLPADTIGKLERLVFNR